jgi:hypothetical protein
MAAARKAAAKRPTVRKPAAKAKRPATRKAPARASAKTRAKAGGKALRLAGVGSEAVLRATGKAWDEWLALLDRAGAKKMPHKEIALMLSRKFLVPDWWSQMVTVGYEQARGLRAVNQNSQGFAANASKTVGVAIARLYEAWSDPRVRARWLADAPLEIRRMTEGKSMRLTWTVGGSSIEVGFFPKGAEKSVVQVSHGKLASAAAVKRQKIFWGEALERLQALLAPRR